MPAPIVGALEQFIGSQLGITVWDGEVPRYDPAGNAVNPESITVPSDWPVFAISMTEGGFSRNNTTESAYDDQGPILMRAWATTREEANDVSDRLESLFADLTNWLKILTPAAAPSPGGPSRPYYVISILLTGWTVVQEKNFRLQNGQLLYRADQTYSVNIHGNIYRRS